MRVATRDGTAGVWWATSRPTGWPSPVGGGDLPTASSEGSFNDGHVVRGRDGEELPEQLSEYVDEVSANING